VYAVDPMRRREANDGNGQPVVPVIEFESAGRLPKCGWGE
jgi:hypothetical protein